MDTLPGAIGLLAGAVSYMLGVCAPLGPEEMALPTPCPHWDLARLLSHLCESMADLEAALRTGRLDLDGPPGRTGGDPVEALRDRAAELLCAGYCYGGPERFVTVDGLPIPAGVVACTGAVEIAVHGWDVSQAVGTGLRMPEDLAARLYPVAQVVVSPAERGTRFAEAVPVPASAPMSTRLLAHLGRRG